jgi:hypothetical protein
VAFSAFLIQLGDIIVMSSMGLKPHKCRENTAGLLKRKGRQMEKNGKRAHEKTD